VSCEAPLYILPHCKMVLTLAIERDTQFLASQGVMDYSLLVGLDEQSKELVLGIIGKLLFESLWQILTILVFNKLHRLRPSFHLG